MKSPRPSALPSRDTEDPLVAVIQVRDEQGTLGEELRAAVGSILSDVPLEGETVVSSVAVRCVPEGQASVPNLVVHWHRRPVAVFLLACGDVEELKERHLKTVTRWMEEAETRQLEWVVVVSEGAARGRGRSAWEKVRGEARGRHEEQVVLWEAGLGEAVLPALRRALGATLARGLRDLREHVRGLETRRGTEGWNCAQHAVAQEGLAIVLERARHAKEAMAAYEEAARVLGEEGRGVAFPAPWRNDDAGLISAASPEGRERLYRSQLTVFSAHSYLAGRMLQLAARHEGPESVLRRAALFLRVHRRRAPDPAWGKTWAAQAWREVAGLAGREHWAGAVALREAALLDGGWSELAVSSAAPRVAAQALFFSGGEASRRLRGEGWDLLFLASLNKEAEKGGTRELLCLWVETREPSLLVRAEENRKKNPAEAEVFLDEPGLRSEAGLRWERADEDSARVWLTPVLSVRVPLEQPAVERSPRGRRGSFRLEEKGRREEKSDTGQDEAPDVVWEARAQAAGPRLTEVRVFCERSDARLERVAGEAAGGGGGVLLEGPAPHHVEVTYRCGTHGRLRTAVAPVVRGETSGQEKDKSEEEGLGAWECAVGLTEAGPLEVGRCASLVARARLGAVGGVLELDGGEDWLVCGPVRRLVPPRGQEKERDDEVTEVRFAVLGRRAGLLLLPQPRLAGEPGLLRVRWTGLRAVAVRPPTVLVCATRPAARVSELEGEGETERGRGKEARAAVSPDPRHLRYSAPGNL